MSAATQDFELAALAAGFTIGFGFLTVWEAIKQTRRNRNPLRSVYIYMLWGEIFVNAVIAVIGWLFLHGKIGPSVQVLFFILFFWVFQIQLLMQIIINRIALIAEHRTTLRNIKWGTVVVITSINIAVFCIWIPAHTVPPVSNTFVAINNVWDKISKVLILVVDAGLNWYFLRTVKVRLVQQHGLNKYAPLIGFNAKLMVLSVAMDALLIGLMFLHNQVVYIQFHPVVYMVKLNIEMSMASLVVRLAQGKPQNDMDHDDVFHTTTTDPTRSAHARSQAGPGLEYAARKKSVQLGALKSFTGGKVDGGAGAGGGGGIECRTDVAVTVEKKGAASERSSGEVAVSVFGDEIPLRKEGLRVGERAV